MKCKLFSFESLTPLEDMEKKINHWIEKEKPKSIVNITHSQAPLGVSEAGQTYNGFSVFFSIFYM